ncbi:hypothetical protein HNY73_013799 [Argiope bruennichi]|uniref:Gustatory receptor n=1 Tax=Argiope bruennichi TaxID=94029 RepID=A0A8T0EM88_ARGBR|nr:hypothetical protein HNY73_013799 [Argiope bruennichi]
MKKCSSKAFTSSMQVDFLEKRLRIVSVLEEIQEIFSVPIFIICTANFVACIANLAQIVVYASKNAAPTVVEVVFMSSNTVASMLCIFCSAGQVPTEMQKFSATARRHLEQRAILGMIRENLVIERLMLDETFTMSGCELIFYKKSTILTILGTILTYGLLILSIDLNAASKN